MNIQEFKSVLGGNLINIPGWHTNRKIIVIESDDWGSIRMPSRDTYEELLKKKIDVESDPFNKYDSLENEEDISELLTMLIGIKDKKGNHPVITTNFIMANPDFQKIKLNNFNEYFYEPFIQTYLKYPKCQNSLELIMAGINRKILFPQFHGREHVNVNQWLRLLKNGIPDYRVAFDYETFAVSSKFSEMVDNNVLAAFDYNNEVDKSFILDSIENGFDLFEKIFGFKSVSIIAPCYVWDKSIESITNTMGVRYLQTTIIQNIAGTGNNFRYKKKYNIIGRNNFFGQTYLGRNSYFEPSTDWQYDWVSKCLQKIEFAFRWGKPAVISMHRLNFIGSVFPENRKRNLEALKSLLNKAIEKWPDIEFLNSQQLGDLITNKDNE